MFAVGGGIDRRCIAVLEVEKTLAKGELEFLKTSNEFLTVSTC